MIRALMFLPLSMAVASIASPGVACEKSFALQKSAPPLPSGTVVFQAGSGNTAELYLFDTISHKQTNLTKTWPLIYTPVNGHISADGQNVVFTAVSCPGMTKRDYSCTQQTSARTDIYLWHAGSSALIGLTTGLPNSRYEDVIFTPDDSGVLLKQNGQIASYSMDYTNPNAPKLGAARTLPSLPPGEASGPYPTYDNLGFYFWIGSDDVEDVYYADYAGGWSEANVPGTNLTYFPVASSTGAAFLVAHDGHVAANGNPVDQIYMEAPGGTAFETIAVNMCSADNSDPAPIGATSVLFSNDNTGNYLPFLADLSTGDIWSLAKIGVGRGVVSVLGMSFTSTRLTPH
jgi:Tol biopolymer transport system component